MYDVAIIGGGPAGSTTAALLARAGRRVIVFEREKFPRFHIGESLLPFSMKAFTRLGLHEKLLRAGFIKKYGGEIMGACSDTGTKFYFKDGYRSQTDHSYQVTRGDFDKVLLDHARESGAHVHEQIAVFFSAPVCKRSNDVNFPYHQDPDFFYLTGSDEPDALLIISTEDQQAGNLKSKKPTIISRSYPSSRITTASGARKESTAH